MIGKNTCLVRIKIFGLIDFKFKNPSQKYSYIHCKIVEFWYIFHFKYKNFKTSHNLTLKTIFLIVIVVIKIYVLLFKSNL